MKVTLKDESLPEGAELHVRGLGMLVNGKTVDFSKAEEEAFEARSGMKLSEAFRNNPNVEVGSVAKGGDD